MKHTFAGMNWRHGWLAACLAATVCLGQAAPTNTDLPPLTDRSGNKRIPGKFVWADLVTDDVAAARNFYGSLFGWTFEDKGGYTIANNAGQPVCGMFQRPRPTDRPDAKPRWFGYLSVPDVAQAQSAVTAAGGRVVAPPRSLPRRGEQAIFADPEGAVFGVVKSSAGDPPDYLPDRGDWIWIGLLSRDARKATDFYRPLGAYEVRDNVISRRPNDYVLVSGGYARAAVLTIPPDKTDVQPGWLPFVRVKNIGDCVAQVDGLGGRVLLAPDKQLFDGKAAVIADPTGAAVGVMEWITDTLEGKY